MAGVGFSESVNHIHQLIPLLRNALYLATSTYRCAHLAIPIDVQLGSVTAPKLLNFRQENLSKRVLSRASDEQIRAVATVLIKERMERHHMVIFCGWRAYNLGDAIEDIADFLKVPVITSFDAKGTIDEDSPHSFGVAGIYGFVGGGSSQSVLENCDIIVGICLPDLAKALTDKSGMQVRRLIQIESDLVVGDSMRFLAVHSFESNDLACSLQMVLEAMKREKETMKLSFDDGQSNEQHHITHKSRLSILPDDLTPAKEGFCHPGVFFKTMSIFLKEDAILCADIGDNALWMASEIIAKRGQRTITSEVSSSCVLLWTYSTHENSPTLLLDNEQTAHGDHGLCAQCWYGCFLQYARKATGSSSLWRWGVSDVI